VSPLIRCHAYIRRIFAKPESLYDVFCGFFAVFCPSTVKNPEFWLRDVSQHRPGASFAAFQRPNRPHLDCSASPKPPPESLPALTGIKRSKPHKAGLPALRIKVMAGKEDDDPAGSPAMLALAPLK